MLKMTLRIHNSLSKQVEEFHPINPSEVTMYLCGPTVYNFVTIGNIRTYTLGDFVYRVLKSNGYKVNYIMNMTDVGHLAGDNVGNADIGEDRIESAAEKEGKSAKEIANFYIADFLKVYDRVNLSKPRKFTRASEYIQEQIDVIRALEQKGYVYMISDGVYFDTSKFSKYGELSGLTSKNVKEGARVEINPEKRNSTDFALWKLSPPGKMRWQEWDSPWGRGFPGWHIECSAMAMKELGPSIDLHLGGEDLKMIHHQNEIAQSECATGKEYVKYWMHSAFLLVDEGKMGKSLGNAYTLSDIEAKGFDALALRYFYMTAHYRTKLNFTWEGIASAASALNKLYDIVSGYQEVSHAPIEAEYLERFYAVLNDDINFPKALSVVWDLLKSNVDEGSKIVTLLRMDDILGLNIIDYVGFEIPQRVLDLAKMRDHYRRSGIWDKADSVRREIEQAGFTSEDSKDGYKIKRKLT